MHHHRRVITQRIPVLDGYACAKEGDCGPIKQSRQMHGPGVITHYDTCPGEQRDQLSQRGFTRQIDCLPSSAGRYLVGNERLSSGAGDQHRETAVPGQVLDDFGIIFRGPQLDFVLGARVNHGKWACRQIKGGEAGGVHR